MAGPEETDGLEALRSVVAAGRAWVGELVEEGLCEFERTALEPPETRHEVPAHARAEGRPAAASPATPDATTSAPPAFGAEDRGAEGLFAGRVPWSAEAPPTLEAVRDHLGDCTRCSLCEGRQTIVFGDGNPEADLMFIGEGPGEQEDRRGLPFVGRAGELLTQMIEKGIGIRRRDVYICNIVKCRPPRNRTPLPPEVSACRPFLDGQILAVAPKVIVTLGKPAASLLLDREIAITRLRGTWHEYRGIPLMPTLHPAYLLRQYTPENRRAVWQDLQAALERSRA
jgi:DNA polymerase